MYHRRPNDDDPPHRKLAKQNNEAEDPPPLLIVPEEILKLIMSYLTIQDVDQLRTVCRLMKQRIEVFSHAWRPLEHIHPDYNWDAIEYKLQYQIEPLRADSIVKLLADRPDVMRFPLIRKSIKHIMNRRNREEYLAILRQAMACSDDTIRTYMQDFIRPEDMDLFLDDDTIVNFLEMYPEQLSVLSCGPDKLEEILTMIVLHGSMQLVGDAFRVFPNQLRELMRELYATRLDIISYLAETDIIEGLDVEISKDSVGTLEGVTTIGGLSIDGDYELPWCVNTIQGHNLYLIHTEWENMDRLAPPFNLSDVRGVYLTYSREIGNLWGLRGLYHELDVLSIEHCHKLSNLTGLNGVTELGQLELIGNSGLTSLDGLNSVKSIIHIEITDNDVLDNIDALSNIDPQSPCVINISSNPRLRHLDGLSGIKGEIVALTISTTEWHSMSNEALTCIDGLRSIEKVINEVELGWTLLQDLRALKRITYIGKGLHIENNSRLFMIDDLLLGLRVGAWADIHHNAVLSRIQGLEAVERVSIHDNPALVTVAGIRARDIKLSRNKSLVHVMLRDCNDMTTLVISENERLTHIQDPICTAPIMRSVHLDSNALLRQAPDFPMLRDIRLFWVASNKTMSAMGTYPSLVNVQRLTILNCPNLVTINGFSALVTVTQQLSIQNNDSLKSLQGLESLRQVGRITITENDQLCDYTALLLLQNVESCYIDVMPRDLYNYLKTICDQVSYNVIVDDVVEFRRWRQTRQIPPTIYRRRGLPSSILERPLRRQSLMGSTRDEDDRPRLADFPSRNPDAFR